MPNFIVYNKNTGDILRTGQAPESMIEMQVDNSNEAVVEGSANDVCDQVDLKTKQIIKGNHSIAPNVEGERYDLIQQRARQNSYLQAEAELIKEGKIDADPTLLENKTGVR